MVDTSVILSGIKLDNPIIPASGTFNFGKEFTEFYDINCLGSLVTKGITKEPRIGNELPRIAECKAGMLNSVGLQNLGVDEVINSQFGQLKTYFKKPVVANISGFSIEEYAYVTSKIAPLEQVGIIEVNVSCPNVKHGGMSFGTDKDNLAKVVRAVREKTSKPIFIKLSPNVTNISELAVTCKENGADGISLINTLLGARIDIKTGKYILANKFGGYSGYGIFPVAVRMVAEVYNATKLPIMGMGGVSCAEDVIELMLAGATAVQTGAINLVNPLASKEIIDNLPKLCEKLGINKLSDIIGMANK
ncbi:MAG: dihydroorotate dehydrogenase [Clostridia bacterium]